MNLVSQVKYQSRGGNFVVTSSYDNSAKVRRCRVITGHTFIYCILSCVYFCYLMCIVLLSVLAVLHGVVAALLARSQYLEGPANGHLTQVFLCFRV
jgi:hypothetical protein